MKKIFIALLPLMILSCKKEDLPARPGQTCWKCVYGTVNGTRHEDVNICNDGSEPKPPRIDDAGNELSYSCQKQ